MTSRLDLLKREITRGARADRRTVQFGPNLARLGHRVAVEPAVSRTVLEFQDYAFIESTQLARDLLQVEALLPAVQAMRGGVGEMLSSGEPSLLLAVRGKARNEILQ